MSRKVLVALVAALLALTGCAGSPGQSPSVVHGTGSSNVSAVVSFVDIESETSVASLAVSVAELEA